MAHGEAICFMNGSAVAQWNYAFNGVHEFNVLRAMTNWKMHGQLPKRVIN
jgi:hypothetical protein